MRRSELFVSTRKQAPADEESKNAQLLIRAGYIHKEMAGVYSYLPLGMKVAENIKQIVREEMNAIGGEEMILSTLQHPHIWQATDRWDDAKVDVWFKAALGKDSQVGFGWSHEEPMARLMTQFISSYKDLPVYTYQFQTKLRRELRAKSGLLRGREFIMKDLYSFSRDRAEHDKFYEQISESYMRIYQRLGIGDITYKTFASGGPFSKFSHEFQTLSPVGEDTIYFHEGEGVAINKEVLSDEVLADLGIARDGLVEKTAVEVGNIFTFGSRYSEPLGLFYTDEKGIQQPVFMGSYGIGISRLMGLLAEHFADDNGLIWPRNVAPYQVYLARLSSQPEVTKAADQLYDQLENDGISVLYDDSDLRPGEKFADADLLGLPLRVVASEKSLTAGGFELKLRTNTETSMLPKDKLIDSIKQFTSEP
ncbi:MAG TPA: aminoacyl--tRNA ligase-related protein [Candidatus Saccharimonadales bacterium]|nr:aminoacyl--tRNA ligase-related protein [Candidatus Saccharimonadales bacterium]